jgi:hypothetical protein
MMAVNATEQPWCKKWLFVCDGNLGYGNTTVLGVLGRHGGLGVGQSTQGKGIRKKCVISLFLRVLSPCSCRYLNIHMLVLWCGAGRH